MNAYPSETKRRYRIVAASALAALWLSACGGGGGGGDPIAAAPAPAPGAAPAPAPAPGPAPAPAPAVAVQISANTTALPNTAYEVNAAVAGTIDVTLPAAPAAGDVVSVRGVSGNAWRLLPNAAAAQPQAVVTTSLSGNVAPGDSWTARLSPKEWHWIASDPLGLVLVAADIDDGSAVGHVPGNLNVSTDGGVTWTIGNSTPGLAWISASVRRTTTGDIKMFAAAYGDTIYQSADLGVTWTQIMSADAGVNLVSREWESVTMSQSGTLMAGVILNGPIYYSANGGANWAAATAVGAPGTALVRGWRAIGSSRLGDVMVAASEDGQVWTSADGGATWTEHDIVIAGTTVTSPWYRVAISDDGQHIAVGGRYDSRLYVSHDAGVTWAQTGAPVGDYTTVAMSADGQVIGATITNGAYSSTTGSVQLSRDGGASFAPVTMPGMDTNWRAFGMAADGNRFAVAAGTFLSTSGQLYTSQGNRTTYGALGSITGGQNDSVEVEYIGNGKFNVRGSAGGPFAIQ